MSYRHRAFLLFALLAALSAYAPTSAQEAPHRVFLPTVSRSCQLAHPWGSLTLYMVPQGLHGDILAGCAHVHRRIWFYTNDDPNVRPTTMIHANQYPRFDIPPVQDVGGGIIRYNVSFEVEGRDFDLVLDH